MANFFNITGETTQELLAAGANVKVNKISLTNMQRDQSCNVDLYIEKSSKGKFYLIKTTLLPFGATLIYDDIKFSNSGGEFGLYIKLNKIEAGDDSPAVDVIIN
jgi:sulfate adenylyltransferase subunit 1 (EFTu-like GTPase family)|tara:strand:+ start:73 stop:384 length:312 start_codon:yes stop_codon:yes gene_type:complete